MITYSIISKSQLEGARRLDAEYYQPEYLKLDKVLESIGYIQLNQISEIITDGDHGNPEYSDVGIPYIKSENLNEFNVELDAANKISNEYTKKIRKACFSENNDVLLTTVGRIGTSTINYKLDKFILSRDIARIHLKNNSGFSPEFIAIFFNSKLGTLLTTRESVGTIQQGLYLNTIGLLKIPKAGLNQQEIIRDFFQKARKEYTNSKLFYSQAENLLLEELGLKNFESEDDLFSIVNLSEVKVSNRIDAEYYQPKYEKLISKIKNQNSKTLENFVKEYSTGFPFKSENYQEQGVPLIRINNIRKGFIDLSDSAYLSEKDYLLSPKDTARPGDIVLSMSGTIGMSAIIPEDVPKCIINQRILRINPKDIDKNYLALLLNSIIGSYQLERIGTGGVQKNISYKDIRKILIPILSKPIQQKIASLVQKSHESRKKAKELLEQAKTKVEELIEK